MHTIVYYDDEAPDGHGRGTLKSTLTRLQKALGAATDERVKLQPLRPSDPQTDTDRLENRHIDDGYAVVLDMRLEKASSPNGTQCNYTGASIAQELRTREALEIGGDWRPWCFPLALISLDTRLHTTYTLDPSTRDLFDIAVRKELLSDASDLQQVAKRLISLSEGYRSIRRSERTNDAATYLGPLPTGVVLPPSVRMDLEGERKVHAKIERVLHRLLDQPGILASWPLVLARLGLAEGDLTRTDTAALRESLRPCEMTGPFRRGWPRWWWDAIECWWQDQSGQKRSPRTLSASERATVVSRAIGRELPPAEPIKLGYGDRYWAICEKTGRPLDLLDAVRTRHVETPDSMGTFRYAHIDEVLSMAHDEEIHPDEIVRVRHLRAQAVKDDEPW